MTKYYPINLSDSSLIYEHFNYPAGETQVRIIPSEVEAVRNAEEIRVSARLRTPSAIIKLALLTNAIRGLNDTAFRRLILPYLPYGRADRRFRDGDCFGLQTFAQIINGLMYDHVLTLDAHSEIANRCIAKLTDVSPIEIIELAIRRIKAKGVLTILYPDEGAVNRYNLPAEVPGSDGEVKLQVLHCAKKRDPQTGKLSGFKVPRMSEFASQDVLIVDDICDGGGTFIGIADTLGGYDLKLRLYVTHGIFSNGLIELKKRFAGIYTSDSVYLHGPEATVFSCESLIARSC